jgi:hypothetical protein
MRVKSKIAVGGIYRDVRRILESGDEEYIDCLKKSIAALFTESNLVHVLPV